jgi:hypothetical protein
MTHFHFQQWYLVAGLPFSTNSCHLLASAAVSQIETRVFSAVLMVGIVAISTDDMEGSPLFVYDSAGVCSRRLM